MVILSLAWFEGTSIGVGWGADRNREWTRKLWRLRIAEDVCVRMTYDQCSRERRACSAARGYAVPGRYRGREASP